MNLQIIEKSGVPELAEWARGNGLNPDLVRLPFLVFEKSGQWFAAVTYGVPLDQRRGESEWEPIAGPDGSWHVPGSGICICAVDGPPLQAD